MELAELARRHPDVPFIAAHTGADWEVGIRAIRDCKNVSAELCGSDPTAGFTEMAVRELGAERVLYGSDAGGRSFASQLGKVLGRGHSGIGEAADPGRELQAAADADPQAEGSGAVSDGGMRIKALHELNELQRLHEWIPAGGISCGRPRWSRRRRPAVWFRSLRGRLSGRRAGAAGHGPLVDTNVTPVALAGPAVAAG